VDIAENQLQEIKEQNFFYCRPTLRKNRSLFRKKMLWGRPTVQRRRGRPKCVRNTISGDRQQR